MSFDVTPGPGWEPVLEYPETACSPDYPGPGSRANHVEGRPMARPMSPEDEAEQSDGGRRQRTWTPIVDQHATWIAVNPIQGCPKSCAYCFLNDRGQTAVHPQQLATATESTDLLLGSQFYEPSRPVALYTWTDVMALATSRAHLADLLEELVQRGVTNPIVLITKCRVPDETIEVINSARDRGLIILVYLSYSGLTREIERGISHDAVMENFPRLVEAGIPIVHYWRPAFPASADLVTMREVIDHAARYARCTVAAGLKVEQAAVSRLSRVWPELATTPGITHAEGVYPRQFWDFIHSTWRRHPRYPLFHTNSCALAYTLERSDGFGVFGSTVCRIRNNCPVAQRNLCTSVNTERSVPTENTIEAALSRRGLTASYQLTENGQELLLGTEVATNLAAALTQDLNIRVRVRRNEADDYWSSGTAGATPVILE